MLPWRFFKNTGNQELLTKSKQCNPFQMEQEFALTYSKTRLKPSSKTMNTLKPLTTQEELILKSVDAKLYLS
jgi:hypothetical protein